MIKINKFLLQRVRRFRKFIFGLKIETMACLPIYKINATIKLNFNKIQTITVDLWGNVIIRKENDSKGIS
jgi:predicted transcriptional regulator